MTGRKREDDFLVEPLFAALRGEEHEPPQTAAQLRRRGWWFALTVLLIAIIWYVTVGALGNV